MPATLEQTGPNVVTPRSVFILRFTSTVALWSVALLIMFSGYEILFWVLISVFGMIGLWEFYRMLDHKGLPNFKITGMICGAVMLAGSFYYFSRIGPAGSYDFEVAVLLFFLLTVFARQMFTRLRNDEPLQTMAYTLFGLLYVLWLFNFITKIVYLTPRSSSGQVTGQFYVLYLIAVTKFTDMGAYLTGSVIGRHLMVPHISAKKTWEGFFGAIVFALLCSLATLQTHAGPFIGAQLDTRDSARTAARVCRSRRRFGRIDYQAQHRRKRLRQSAPGNWRSARPDGQPAFYRAAVVFLHAPGDSGALSNLFFTAKATRDTKIRKAPKELLYPSCAVVIVV